jgi:hypothetical protein
MKKIKTILKSQNEYIREKNIENGILRLRKNQIVTFEKCKINTLIITKSDNSLIYFKNCNIRWLSVDDHLALIEVDNSRINSFTVISKVDNIKLKDNSQVENLKKFTSTHLNLNIENSYIGKLFWTYNTIIIQSLNSKIDNAEFRYAIFDSDTCNANFKSTHLYNCFIPNVKNFDFGYLYINPISSILQAGWGILPPKLTALCMAYDAQNHPDPNKFTEWANGGGTCPYNGYTVRRAITFQEKPSVWNPELLKKPINTIDLIKKLFREKNIKAKFVVE